MQHELDRFKKSYNFVAGDELWMVVDRDRWTEQHLGLVAQKCNQKGYFLAVSVPCFETWLLLHVADFSSEDLSGLNCDQVAAKIRQTLGAYNKTNPPLDRFIPNVERAIERARRLETSPTDRWSQTPGSRVYLLA